MTNWRTPIAWHRGRGFAARFAAPLAPCHSSLVTRHSSFPMPHRFFIDLPLTPGTDLVLPDAIAHQVSRVLRLRAGETILLCDGEGRDFPLDLTRLAAGQVGGRVGAGRVVASEPAIAVTLYVA